MAAIAPKLRRLTPRRAGARPRRRDEYKHAGAQFHEALLDALEDLPGKWRAAIASAEQAGSSARVLAAGLDVPLVERRGAGLAVV